VFGSTNELDTVQIPVVAEVTVTAPPAVDDAVSSKLPEEPIWSLMAGKLITFAVPTMIVGSMYMFEPSAKPPVPSKDPLTNLNLYMPSSVMFPEDET